MTGKVMFCGVDIENKKYGDVCSVEEIAKEHLVLQQEKLGLKYAYLCTERNRLYYEHLGEDRDTWPTVVDAAEKLSAARKEKNRVKKEYDQEKEKIWEKLQTASEEYEQLQAKVKKLKDKAEIFKSKQAQFESRRHLNPAAANTVIQKCQAAVERLEKEISAQRVTLAGLDQSLADLRAQARDKPFTSSNTDAKDMIQRAKKVLSFLEEVQGLRILSATDNEIKIEMTRTPPAVTQKDENFKLQLKLTFQSGCHGNPQLTDVKINVEHFKIKDVVDVAIATNDVPYLVMSVQETWMNHFPLLSELDLLTKHHVTDWIPEQSHLRVLVGNCGKVMFTLQIPKDYPNTRGITLLDMYGIDDVDREQLPGESATMLDWVTHLENKYGHISLNS